jgi:hypothetical protein
MLKAYWLPIDGAWHAMPLSSGEQKAYQEHGLMPEQTADALKRFFGGA